MQDTWGNLRGIRSGTWRRHRGTVESWPVSGTIRGVAPPTNRFHKYPTSLLTSPLNFPSFPPTTNAPHLPHRPVKIGSRTLEVARDVSGEIVDSIGGRGKNRLTTTTCGSRGSRIMGNTPQRPGASVACASPSFGIRIGRYPELTFRVEQSIGVGQLLMNDCMTQDPGRSDSCEGGRRTRGLILLPRS
jgi:hypothetical protein